MRGQSIADLFPRLIRMIPAGEGQAVDAATLCAALGLVDHRDLRRVIRKAREAGELICSSRHGYWKPTTPGELRGFVQQWEAHSRSTASMLASAREALEEAEAAQARPP